MYRVLLVDDEENVLQILKNTVSWQEMGVDLLLTAQGARQALEVLERQQVHLLITDIKMPGMDGISLIRRVKEAYPHIRCILLTAYGEFEYAREAIRLGVENYLLKPVVREEVEQTVQKALDNLYGGMQNGESLLRENILRRWANGTITEEELSERASVLGLNLYLPEYCVICLVKKREGDVHTFRTACVELLSKQLEICSFWDEKGRYILIAGGRKLDTEELENQLSRLAEQQMESRVGIAIGVSVSDAGNLHLSYRTACDSVELSDLDQPEVILKSSSNGPDIGTEGLVEEVRFLFFSEEERTRENGYQHLCHKLYRSVRNGETDKETALLLRICMRVLVTEFPLHKELQEKMFGVKWKMEKEQTEGAFLEETGKILRHAQDIFMECLDLYSPVVQLAIRYIRKSVMEGTGGSVKEFCAINGMNPAYLGHLYKKETGIFFNDYLAGCRISRSIILLRNPNNKIKDIAERVGFASVSYYVKCFRENKGISPARYRLGLTD